jgi:protein SCO1/2
MRDRKVRLAAWLCVAALLFAAFGFLATHPAAAHGIHMDAQNYGDAAPAFTLTDQHGKPFNQSQLEGKASLFFFGYTSCPDVCPAGLADITRYMEKLGKDASKIQPVFVTVDPAKDTAKQMAEYLKAFDARIIGLTGTDAQISTLLKDYHVYAAKPKHGEHDEAAADTINHTATMYLYDKNRRFIGTIDRQEKDDVALAKIRRVIKD